MTKREIELCKLSNAQMPPEELQRITRLVADTKRFVEMYALLPYVREELDRDFEGFIKKHDLNVDKEGMQLLTYEEYEDERERIKSAPNKEELIPESSSEPHSNLSTIGFAVGFVLMMVLDVVMG